MGADSLRRKAAALKDMADGFRAGGIEISTIPPEHRSAIKRLMAGCDRIINCQQAPGCECDCRLSRLEHLPKELKQLKFGRSSEKLGKEDRELAAEDIEAGIIDAEAGIKAVKEMSRLKRRTPRRSVGNLPGSLQRAGHSANPVIRRAAGSK